MWIALPVLDDIVDRTLREDLGAGDLTTEATVPALARAVGVAVARGPLVACGGLVFRRVFERLEPSVTFEELTPDGVAVEKGASLWRVRGSARALLSGERSALNLVQRMSGTATAARAYSSALPAGSTTRITDTRKTTPGLRVLERYAVRCGGAHNHRDSLGTAVMIKDNHIIAAGGIEPAVARARARAPHLSRIEVEVANLAELEVALSAGADVIMLDNFAVPELAQAVSRAKGKALLEASGGITLATVAEYARTGVDVISIGALTHSAKAADIALDLTLALRVGMAHPTRAVRALVLAVIVVACGPSHDKAFGVGCASDDDCADGLACFAVSTTAYTACVGSRSVRFCSLPCKEHKDCDGQAAPGGAVTVCVDGCNGKAVCSWVGAK